MTAQFFEYFPQLLQGVCLTVELMLCALTIGLVLAIIFSIAAQSKFLFLRIPVTSFTFFIRGTPLLVQMFLIYYGSGQFAVIRESFLWVFLQNPFACAVVALSLNSSAYTTELIRGAIRAVPRGEIEACQAIGMPYLMMMRRVIFRRVMGLILPAYSNEVMMVLKGTTLASAITLMDIMGVTRRIISENYAAIVYFVIAGVIYLLLNALIVGVFRRIERGFYPV